MTAVPAEGFSPGEKCEGFVNLWTGFGTLGADFTLEEAILPRGPETLLSKGSSAGTADLMTDSPIRLANALEWAKTNFSGIFTTDVRRLKRVINFAARLKDSPGKTIPQLWENSYDVKATYNFLKHRESKPAYLQRGHMELVKKEIQNEGTYLLIEDDSELSWSGKDPIEGLGPVGDFREGLQGFMLHTVIAAKWKDSDKFSNKKRPPLEIIGLADQQYFTRQKGVKKSQRKQGAPSADSPKETDPWFHSMTNIGNKPENSEVRWIRVCVSSDN